MRTKFGIGVVWLLVALCGIAPAMAHGGGGGGGGHGGGGGGGHGGGGGGGGGGMHMGGGGGGGMRMSGGGGGSAMKMGSGNMAPGTFSSGSPGGTGKASNQSTFMKNNFSGQQNLGKSPGQTSTGSSAIARTANRIDSSSAKSFVKSNDIGSKNQNNWAHKGNDGQKSGNWNNGNKGNWSNNNWNKNGNNNWNNHNHTVVIFNPFFGWGLWGWPYYGWGYGSGYPLFGYNYYGSGYNYYPVDSGSYAAAMPADTSQLAMANTQGDFVDQGEADFKSGRFPAAARDWQHALVDDPRNGAVMMLFGQALFAVGQFNEAAAATQAGMQMLPTDKWGVVIGNYEQLYGNIGDYTNQLKALEKARDAAPDDPAIRFLLGFHFGYLGYPKQSVRELDKGLEINPRDLGAFKVREIFAAKLPDAPPPPAAAAEAAAEAARN